MSKQELHRAELNNILLATDFSKSSEQAESVAVSVAAAFDAQLHFVHAFHVLEFPVPSAEFPKPAAYELLLEDARARSRERLNEVRERARSQVRCGDVYLGDVPAPTEIATRAEALGVDLIVVGSQGQTGIQHLLLGSVAEGTVRSAPCSVLTARGPLIETGPVVVGTDFSEPASLAVKEACGIADRLGADLHLVHAVTLATPMVGPYGVAASNGFYNQLFDSAETAIAAEATACHIKGQVTTEVTTKHPQVALNDVAASLGARLIVVGSRGLTGFKHILLGSVAERTLRHADRCVWTVRAREPERS